MISHEQLKEIAKRRLKDAKILHGEKSYTGALYLCGYSIELALKAIICKNLDPGTIFSTSHIPSTLEEFKSIEKLKTHRLEELLGAVPHNIKVDIKSKYFGDWSIVEKWNPEVRYTPKKFKKVDATNVINATERLTKYLFRQI